MVQYMTGSLIAVFAGFAADLIFGDPAGRFHPICLIGNLIAWSEKKIRSALPETKRAELIGGFLMAVLVILISTGIPLACLFFAYRTAFWLGVFAETVMCFFIFAVKSLKRESMNVGKALQEEGLCAGRKAVARIVGRDTDQLPQAGVVKAAVETVAENFSDGVFAPMLYLMIGGGAFGFFYKSINTMDSMVGYKNETYRYFGRFCAKLDDAANYIPSRLAAFFLMTAALFCGQDAAASWRIWKRDRRNHASPNSAQTEAAVAGALHVRLAGDAYYFGELYKKPFIGDDLREIEVEDIARTNRLMVTASALALFIMGGLKLLLILG